MKLLSFFLGAGLFALEVKWAGEINRKIQITPVPAAPPEIAGIYNLRGQPATLFRLDRMLGLGDICEEPAPGCIILKPAGRKRSLAGFLISSPGDIFDFPNGELAPLRESLGEAGGFALGEAGLKGRAAVVIDAEKIFNKI